MRRISWFLFLTAAFLLPGLCAAQSVTLLNDVSASIPFNLIQGYLVMIDGDIGTAHHLKFIIDTGTTHSYLDRAIARRLGLTLQPETIFYFGNKLRVQTGFLQEISLGPLRGENIPVNVADLTHLERPDIHVDGIIGLDVLRLFPFQIDYDRHCIVFGATSPLAETIPMADQWFPVIPFEFHNGTTQLMIDTGAHKIVLYLERTYPRGADWTISHKKVMWSSLGSVVNAQTAFIRDIAFCPDKQALEVYLIHAPPSSVPPDVDGVLAPVELGIHQISFDFDQHKISWSR